MNVGIVIPVSRVDPEVLNFSLDATADIADSIVVVHNDYPALDRDNVCELARERQAISVHLPGPVGKTEAVIRGLEVLLSQGDVELLGQLDANAKQPPSELTRLIRAASVARSEMCVANRYSFQSLSSQRHRASSTSLWSQLIRLATGYELTDAVSGMRIYSQRLARAFVDNIRCYGYGLEVAQLISASMAKARVSEVGVVSHVQANSTSVEKIEDNINVLLAQPDLFTSAQRLALCEMMTGLKRRETFTVPGIVFNLRDSFQFLYAGKGEDDEDSYKVHLQEAE